MITTKIKKGLYTILGMSLMLPLQMAQAAQDLAASMDGLISASTKGTELVFIASALIGIGLMIAGGLQLKKYADNPQQNGIAKPMIYLLSGVLVFGVVAMSDTMDQTLFGETGRKKAVNLEEL